MSASTSGVIGGGQLGYNWQIGAFVLGGEWDFDWPSLNASGGKGPGIEVDRAGRCARRDATEERECSPCGRSRDFLSRPRIEYDYLGLNRWTLNSTVFAPNADQLSVKRQINMLTVGLNYKF
jgi:opacity protein-like surface antigen